MVLDPKKLPVGRLLPACRVLSRPRPICLAARIGSILAFSLTPSLAGEPAIRSVKGADGRPAAFEAVNLPTATLTRLADLASDDGKFGRLFSVCVADDAGRPDQPSMLGTYSLTGTTLRFTPRYPLRAGLKYRVTLFPSIPEQETGSDPGQRDAPLCLDVMVPEAGATAPTEVAQVYPTSAALPENQLRFYIRFSAPMGRGEAYEHLRLLKADGRPVDLPFLEIGEELWDASGERLTLLIDPGRIKRGVKPLEDLGPALQAGQTFTLVIDAGWKNAAGRPLKKEFRKTFKVVAPLRKAIEPAQWKIIPPRSDSKDPLIVRFERSLDRGLLEHTLSVSSPNGDTLAGRITIADDERRWEFRPETRWITGGHQLIVDTSLEDTAGNRIGVPFEVDVTGTISKRTLPESVRIPFTVADGRN
jgi:hypothetical protein